MIDRLRLPFPLRLSKGRTFFVDGCKRRAGLQQTQSERIDNGSMIQ